MTRKEFRELFQGKIVLLDGATGTYLHKNGMPSGVCPEKWASEHTNLVMEVQRGYVESGSDIIYSFTLGANPIKLDEFGLRGEAYAINRELARVSKEAAGGKALVAGDMSPSGSLLAPFGEVSFEESIQNYKEQARGLLDGGVDLFVVETMLDIQEARSAILAVRELCDLPIMVTMTFEAGLRTLMGTDPVSALVTLQSLGADAVGCNCSSGPAEMVEILKLMKPYARVPLVAKPNAGKPRLVSGKTVFDMKPDEFCSYAKPLLEAGANGLGGCCGTSPEYIRQLAGIVAGYRATKHERIPAGLASSNRRTVVIRPDLPLTVIGERLNPTGKKALKEAIINNDMDRIADLAREQMEAGADMLDVNAGVPGVDEKEALVAMVNAVCDAVPLPVCLDSSNPAALEAALRIYPGRAVINSVSGESAMLGSILPLAAKYGAMLVLLPIDDDGVPESAEKRIEIIRKVYEEARRYGFEKEDILVDGVTMTVAAGSHAAEETLKVISWCANEFGINTVVGLSNVSFGLPERGNINAAFLAMAASSGLSTAIMNPNDERLMDVKRASDVLKARDVNARAYISRYSEISKGKPQSPSPVAEKSLYEAVVNGMADTAAELAGAALNNGYSPREIIEGQMIPAIRRVGQLYEEKKYFLPQLIKGAEAMQNAMRVLSPQLEARAEGDLNARGTVILATVKGDIHDIGKNIVGLLLKNCGFKVIDLGKDVPAESIIRAARDNNADIIGLSALMTTTMTEMPKVAALAREAGLNAKIMVGGAVLDKEYAESFNAWYSKDAYSAVKLAEDLVSGGSG